MAKNDIRVHRSPHGGHVVIQHAQVDTAAPFLQGEAVLINTDGELSEAATEPGANVPTELVGIAAVGALDAAKAHLGPSVGTVALLSDSGHQVGYYAFDNTTEFETDNFTSDDDAVLDGVPAEGDVGSLCNLRRSAGGGWGVSNNASGTNIDFVITRVLDARGDDVSVSGGTGVTVVFKKAPGTGA
jgi:hypothetical protein